MVIINNPRPTSFRTPTPCGQRPLCTSSSLRESNAHSSQGHAKHPIPVEEFTSSRIARVGTESSNVPGSSLRMQNSFPAPRQYVLPPRDISAETVFSLSPVRIPSRG